MTDPKIELVQQMYGAFGSGDVDAILAMVADDVDWNAVPSSSSAPWYGRYHGKSGVARFFQQIGTNVTVDEFVPLTFTSNGTDVMAVVQWHFTAKRTGRTVATQIAHLFRFAGDKVAYVRTWEDTIEAGAAFA